MTNGTDLLRRAVELKAAVDKHNQNIAVQQAMYDRYLAQIAEYGLTPDSIELEITQLNTRLQEITDQLDGELLEIERGLNGHSSTER